MTGHLGRYGREKRVELDSADDKNKNILIEKKANRSCDKQFEEYRSCKGL